MKIAKFFAVLLITYMAISYNHGDDYYQRTEIEGYVESNSLTITSFRAVIRGSEYGNPTFQKMECSKIPFESYYRLDKEASSGAEVAAVCDKPGYYHFQQIDKKGNIKYERATDYLWCEQNSDIEIVFIE